MQICFEVIKTEAHRFLGIKKDGKVNISEECFSSSTSILEEKENKQKEHINLKDKLRVLKILLRIAFQEKFGNHCA